MELWRDHQDRQDRRASREPREKRASLDHWGQLDPQDRLEIRGHEENEAKR